MEEFKISLLVIINSRVKLKRKKGKSHTISYWHLSFREMAGGRNPAVRMPEIPSKPSHLCWPSATDHKQNVSHIPLEYLPQTCTLKCSVSLKGHMLGSKVVADISLEYLMAKQKQNLKKKCKLLTLMLKMSIYSLKSKKISWELLLLSLQSKKG